MSGLLVFFHRGGSHPDPHSFPTRRSSDLSRRACSRVGGARCGYSTRARRPRTALVEYPQRSEEHTSELQSRVELVCRLLLEKKNEVAMLWSGRTPEAIPNAIASGSATSPT